MKIIKTAHEIATEVGFPNIKHEYPAACGVLLAKMEAIERELDRLRSDNDLDIQDYQSSIKWISHIVDSLFKEENHDSK